MKMANPGPVGREDLSLPFDMDFRETLSYESPQLPTDGSIPARSSARYGEARETRRPFCHDVLVDLD